MTAKPPRTEFDSYCKCDKCRYRNTPKCKVIDGTFDKIAYCRGPYKSDEVA